MQNTLDSGHRACQRATVTNRSLSTRSSPAPPSRSLNPGGLGDEFPNVPYPKATPAKQPLPQAEEKMADDSGSRRFGFQENGKKKTLAPLSSGFRLRESGARVYR